MLLSSCSRCGFATAHCFCAQLPELSCDFRFCLLTHPLEFEKVSNTGKLIKAMFPETLIVNWHRLEPSTTLLNLLVDPCYQPYLLMPEAYAIYQHQKSDIVHGDGNKLFILLDGTWQQARKMYKQSPYLHHLPLMPLLNTSVSRYTLRRNQKEGHLCTAEVAAEILKTEECYDASESVRQAVFDFCQHYRQMQQEGKLS